VNAWDEVGCFALPGRRENFGCTLQGYAAKLPSAVTDPEERVSRALPCSIDEFGSMSRASKTTFLVMTLLTSATIFYVHKDQHDQRMVPHSITSPADNVTQNLRRGVIRDDERQRIKQQRALELQEQQRLEKEYEKVQPVSRSDR